MPAEVRLWTVETGDVLRELTRGYLDLEARLEAWLDDDIGVLSPDLLVIGRQVETDHGGYIDLLCLDRNGDVIVVELKRDKTPREVTAQVLDYASWVRDLSNEQITRIAEAYLARKGQYDLSQAFRERFGTELPEVVNEDHSLLVVGSSIDLSSERIIRYLSDVHGVKINAVTFNYFAEPSGAEHIARVFLLEPEKVEKRSVQKGTSKRRSSPTFEEFEQIAEQQGVGDLYRPLISGLRGPLHPYTMLTSVAFYGKLDGGTRSIFSLLPPKSTPDAGLHFQVYLWRLARLLGRTPEQVSAHLPDRKEPWKYVSTSDQDGSGYAGFFRTPEEVTHFVSLVREDIEPGAVNAAQQVASVDEGRGIRSE
jgi:hypothetical protein